MINAALDLTPDEATRLKEILSASPESNPEPVNDPERKLCECETIAGMQKMASNGQDAPESFRRHAANCPNCHRAFARILNHH